jgi:hypothetical protein
MDSVEMAASADAVTAVCVDMAGILNGRDMKDGR